MTGPRCPVAGCLQSAGDWTICRPCVADLTADLAALPELLAEVRTTLARQGVQGARAGSRGADGPLPYDPRASAVHGGAVAVLVGWVRVLAEDTDLIWPADTPAACALWLGAHIHLIRVHPAAGDITGEIAASVGSCRRVVDRPPQRLFAGPCTRCHTPMYARPGQPTVACPTCRTPHDVADARAAMLEGARDQLLSIPEMLRALPFLVGHDLNDATLRQWHHRGRMLPHGVTRAGRHTFRVGDVLALLAGGGPGLPLSR